MLKSLSRSTKEISLMTKSSIDLTWFIESKNSDVWSSFTRKFLGPLTQVPNCIYISTHRLHGQKYSTHLTNTSSKDKESLATEEM